MNLNASAQIEQEIKNYTDTTKVLVDNGRKMIIQELSEGNSQKAWKIYHYLTNLKIFNSYSAFYYKEKLYITLLTGRLSEWTKLAANVKKAVNKEPYPSSFPIFNFLQKKFIAKSDSIKNLITQSDLDMEKKEILNIYLHLHTSGRVNEQYNKMLEDFHKNFPNSEFQDFINLFLPPKSIEGSFGFSMGSGIYMPTHKLKKNFSPNAGFYMSVDININRVFSSLYLNGQSFYLDKPFTAFHNSETLNFEQNERFFLLDAGLYIGYFLIRNDHFHLAPYISLSGSTLRSTRYEGDNDEKEFKIFESFTTGPGLHTELRLVDFNTKSYYYGPEVQNYLSLKIEAGYNFITQHEFNIFEGNTPYVKMGILWGIGDF